MTTMKLLCRSIERAAGKWGTPTKISSCMIALKNAELRNSNECWLVASHGIHSRGRGEFDGKNSVPAFFYPT